MNFSRTQVVCAVALGGTAGVIAVLMARKRRSELLFEEEARRLEEERVQREVDAAKQKAVRDKRRRAEFDSPKALKRKEEEKRREEERKRFEEQRIEEEKRRIEEEKQLEVAKRMQAEKAVEEEWKRKAEEHVAKLRIKEAEVKRAHMQESEVHTPRAGGQAAVRSAEAEAEIIQEDLIWQKEEEELIRKHHQQMAGLKVKVRSTGEQASVHEAVEQVPFCKVVFADSLEDATPEAVVWAREDAIESAAEIGYEVTVKTLKRIGALVQVSNSNLPYRVKFSDGHSDSFRSSDVDIHRVRGCKVQFRAVCGVLHQFDESGTMCLVHFIEGTLVGETAWLDEDALAAVPSVGCTMKVKSRQCRGKLIKYTDRTSDWPYMIETENGSTDWFKKTDAEPVFEVGCRVTVTSVGLFDEITEPLHERPYQIQLCSGPKKEELDWARICNFSITAEVGSPVKHKMSGRIGEVLIKDDSDLPCKVMFDDGQMPAHDWCKEEDLQVLSQQKTPSP